MNSILEWIGIEMRSGWDHKSGRKRSRSLRSELVRYGSELGFKWDHCGIGIRMKSERDRKGIMLGTGYDQMKKDWKEMAMK